MIQALAKKQYTPEDLLNLPDDGKSYELVDGELVEKNIGFRSSWISGELGRRLGNHDSQRNIGLVLPQDTSYQCVASSPNKVRKPDVSFLRRERIPSSWNFEGHCRVAPDLAVEVTSPHDLIDEVLEKVGEYLEAGVRLVWVIHPPSQSVYVYRSDNSYARLTVKDELSGEGVLPGFRCPVADLFRLPVETNGVS